VKLQRVLAIARKEWIHILRDWRSLVMGIGIPLFLLVIFGYALKLDVDNVPVIIWDQSNTPESREFISRFSGSRYFSLSGGYADNYKEIEYAIDTGKALMGLVIPTDFARRVAAERPAKAQLIVDGSDSNTATLAMGYADAVVEEYSGRLQVEALLLQGIEPPKPPIELRTRVWFNPELESKNNIIPGLVGVLMMVISAMLTSLTISREWERGTMEQLISTPVKWSELILGKLLPYFVIALLDVAIIVVVGYYVFQVPLRGSLILLFVMAIIFLIGALLLGMMISVIAKTQLVSTQMAMILTFLPSFLLSGFLNAITNMPKAVQIITYGVPARYFISLLKSIYLKGVGLSVLYMEALFLIGFAVVMVLISRASFKKKLG
jgi:ABC-2 type transport system permease protein